jgi:cobalt transporter subunit CbtB
MGQLVGQALRLEKVSMLLALLALGALYLLAFDQGQLLSLIQGGVAFDQNLIHEAVHDARHAAGFPCH